MPESATELSPCLVQVLNSLGTIEGTGFVCHQDGYILTCWHVVAGWGAEQKGRVRDHTGQIIEVEWLLERSDQAADVAVLRSIKPTDRPVAYLPLDVHWRVKAGQVLESVGYPKGQFVRSGISTAPQLQGLTPTQVGGITVFALSGWNLDNIDSGYSGAPVVNRMTQKVIGLMHAKHHQTQAFLVPLTPLWNNWPELRTYHDVFEQIRQRLGQQAQAALAERLHTAPFIALNLECGTIPGRKQHQQESESAAEPQTYAHGRQWEECDLTHLLSPTQSFILSSDVGMGKTTFVYWLASQLVTRTRCVPIVMSCEEFERRDPKSLIELCRILIEQIEPKCLQVDIEDFIDTIVTKGELVVLFDGLDQISTGQPSAFIRRVRSILGRHPVLITSRPSAVLALEDDRTLDFLRLRPFTEQDQRGYFGGDYSHVTRMCTAAPELIRVPVLAFMVRELVAQGHTTNVLTRTELYSLFIKHIVAQHDPNRSIYVDAPDLTDNVLNDLQRLAFSALAAPHPYIQKVPTSVYPKDARVKLTELATFGLLNRIMDRGEQALFFTHQSFQEFLAANHAVNNSEAAEQIFNERWNPKWREVIRFLAGLQGDAYIKRLLNERDNVIHSNLFLAANCSKEHSLLDAELKSALFEQLLALCKTPPFNNAAIQSLQDIARSLNEVHIQLLSNSLQDSNSLLRLTAVKILSSLGESLGPEVITSIERLVHDPDLWVRIAAVEGIGRLWDRLNPTMITTIVEIMHENDHSLRDAAIKSLWGLGLHLDASIIIAIGTLVPDMSTLRRLLDLYIDPFDPAQFPAWDCSQLFAPDAPTLSGIRDLMISPKEVIRETAAKILMSLGTRLDSGTILAIRNMLSNHNPAVREVALKVLGESGPVLDPATIAAVVSSVHDDYSSVVEAAVNSLCKLREFLDEPSIAAIRGLLRDENPLMRDCAVNMLGGLRACLDTPTIDSMREMLHGHDEGLLSTSMQTLCEQTAHLDSATIPVIRSLLSHNMWFVRQLAVENLGKNQDSLDAVTIRAISGLLCDSDAAVRASVVRLLNELDIPPERVHNTSAVELLYDPRPYVRGIGLAALRSKIHSLDSVEITAIVGLMRDENYHVGFWAKEAVVELGDRLDTTTIATIVSLLHDSNWSTRVAAADALVGLGNILDAATIATIVSLLRDRADDTKDAVADVLVGLWDRLDTATISTIASLLHDSEWSTRNAATTILSTGGGQLDRATIATIVSLLHDSEWSTRNAATTILSKRCGQLDGATIATIIGLLHDDNEDVRNNSIMILERLGGHLRAADVVKLAVLLGVDRNSDYALRALENLYLQGVEIPCSDFTIAFRMFVGKRYLGIKKYLTVWLLFKSLVDLLQWWIIACLIYVLIYFLIGP